MHDLEEKLTAWREATAKLLPGQEEVAQELEEHLRDQIGASMRLGLSLDAAWANAIQRLGDPRAMAIEFRRIHPRSLNAWWPARLAFVGLAILSVLSFGLLLWRFQTGRLGLLLMSHVFLVVFGYAATFVSGGLGICYLCTRLLRPLTTQERRVWRRSIFLLTTAGGSAVLMGVILGGFWAQENMGRFWGWDAKEIGGLLVLLWTGTLAIAQTRRFQNERVLPMLAALGNVITASAWFGAHNVATGRPFSAILITSVIGLLVLALTGLLPAPERDRLSKRS